MIQRFRRSFRKKKASVCINCQHSSKNCYHAQEYENIKFKDQKVQEKEKQDELLKWLDLDSKPNNAVPNNILLSRQRQLNSLQQRPHSVYNDYSNLVFQNGVSSPTPNNRQFIPPPVRQTECPISHIFVFDLNFCRKFTLLNIKLYLIEKCNCYNILPRSF